MRRISLIATCVLVSATAFAQNYNLSITKSNGDVVTIPTNDVSKIEFIEDFVGDPSFAVTPQAQTVPMIGGKFTFKITANCPWTYEVDNSTVAEISKTKTQLVLDFPWLPEAAGVKYTVKFKYGNEEKSVELNQETTLTADLLDIEYLADGTAVDRSPLNHKVITNPGAGLMTYYNDIHKRYVANFRNPIGETVTSGYYRVNYEKGGDFINRIADGCTFETIVKLNEADAPNKEVKWFSSMQGGGIGFILPIHDANRPGSDCLTFLPNISTTGASTWCWTYSNVKPEPGKYYHVVGVYNKEEAKSYIYVNGVLCGQANTPGNYVPVANLAESFVIGGDPGPNQTNCDASWNGEIVTTRIFDEPMNATEVAKLWKESEFDEDIKADIFVSDLQYLPQCEVAPGYKYSIYGTGFENGDIVELQAIDGDSKFTPTTTVDKDRLTFVIPSDMTTGRYRVILKRSNGQLPLIQVDLTVRANPLAPSIPKVIAHRGAHTGRTNENSIEALKLAMDANYYGIELDIWATSDGVLVVHHDGVANGLTFWTSTYDAIKNIRLGNGEVLPTFESFLNTYKSKMGSSSSKLIIEIKTHGDRNRNNYAVDKAMEMVEQAGIKDRVEYIAFDYENCKRIVSKQKDAKVGYLSGNLAPSVVFKDGICSTDYSYSAYDANPTWIKEARQLGMIVNVWTVSVATEMIRFMSLGVDYITTDAPAVLEELTKKTFVEK